MAGPLAVAGAKALAGAGQRWLQGQALRRGIDAAGGGDGGPVEAGARIAVTGAAIAAAIPLVLLIVTSLPIFLVLDVLPERRIAGQGAPHGSIAFLDIYDDAGSAYEQNPFLLMAIHEGESAFSATDAPGVHSGVNFAGCCAGPMQFDLDTWAGTVDGKPLAEAYRAGSLSRPDSYAGRTEKHPSIYDSYDSIYAAALYLKSLGAVEDLDDPRTLRALITYKGESATAHPNADGDLAKARGYEAELAALPDAGAGGGATAVVPGARGRILPNGLAAAPASAPQPVKRMIAAANAISDKPYVLTHFPTHIDNPSYDCSSSTSHVLWAGDRFGVAPMCSANFTSYGEPGAGKWVTVYARGPCGGQGHVFMMIAGLRFDTNYGYESGGPNRGERGPRWRVGEVGDLYRYTPRHPVGL